MGLEKVSNDYALSRMTTQEKYRWNNSSCRNCKYFNHFLIETNYDNFPMYYNCSARNTTGADFVKEATEYCYFYEKGETI